MPERLQREPSGHLCDHFIEVDNDPWAGTYCKLRTDHAGAHSAHYPMPTTDQEMYDVLDAVPKVGIPSTCSRESGHPMPPDSGHSINVPLSKALATELDLAAQVEVRPAEDIVRDLIENYIEEMAQTQPFASLIDEVNAMSRERP